MTLRKSIYLAIALGLIVGLVACSSSSTPPTIAISATGGTPQSATVGTAFAALQATVTSNGAPAASASVTFTAPSSGASCTFSNGTATETDTATNGVATSSACTANTAAGPFSVTATTSGATASASYSLTNTAGSPAAITAGSGNNQIALINAAYGNPLVANVADADGNPVSGVSVTFTITAGVSGASGAFGTGATATDSETTDSNGNATTSQALTANATAGSFTVTADFSGDTSGNPAVFTLTNSTSTLTAGNYTFQVTGMDGTTAPLPYSMAGVFTLTSSGLITAGEFDFNDYNWSEQATAITGGTVLTNTDGNLVITLNFTDPDSYINYGAGTVTLDAAMATASNGTLIEADAWATGNGDINLQTSTAFCATTPCSYAFYEAGVDGGSNTAAYGGVITVDSAGGISGNGTIWDMNDSNTLYSAEVFTASTVTGPDAFGYVAFNLFTSFDANNPTFIIDGYMIDANHLRLIENWNLDDFAGTAFGAATAQTGAGTFSASNVAGSTFVFGVAGQDGNGPLQSAGAIGFDSADSNITGNVSFNDIATQAPQGGTPVEASTGTYSVDSGSLGDVTVADITDGATFGYNFQMYLTGDGHAYVISMDSTDVQAGLSGMQTSGLTAASFSGNYSLYTTQNLAGPEQDATGTINADGVGTFSGNVDINEAFLIPAGDVPISGTFTVGSTNGVWTGAIVDPVSAASDTVTYYVIDTTQGVVIENDDSQLTLGYYTNN